MKIVKKKIKVYRRDVQGYLDGADEDTAIAILRREFAAAREKGGTEIKLDTDYEDYDDCRSLVVVGWRFETDEEAAARTKEEEQTLLAQRAHVKRHLAEINRKLGRDK